MGPNHPSLLSLKARFDFSFAPGLPYFRLHPSKRYPASLTETGDVLLQLFTALHGMQTRSYDENSVCQTRAL